MADITYDRITPRARSGTAGLSIDTDIEAGTGVWISPPERVSAITVAVHIPSGETGEYAIECSSSALSNITSDGSGGYWDPIEENYASYTESKVIQLTNSVTGMRVRCISCDSTINVCFTA